MKIKTSELIGAPLDWTVGICQGHNVKPWHTYRFLGTPKQEIVDRGVTIGERDDFGQISYDPSNDWATAGPIIEEEKIILDYYCDKDESRAALRFGSYDEEGEYIIDSDHEQTGPTPLIAAMRCYVSSKLGDYVDVPDDLLY